VAIALAAGLYYSVVSVRPLVWDMRKRGNSARRPVNDEEDLAHHRVLLDALDDLAGAMRAVRKGTQRAD
jgi:hypothetical protein